MAPADKHEAILAAALELFAERGFHGTAVPQIADRAGVGAGTIYRYFADKEALVNELYQRWKARLVSAILDEFPFGAPMREQFRVLWRRWAAFVIEHPQVMKFLELHHHQPYLDATSLAIEQRLMRMATDALEDARRQRIVRDVPAPVLIALAEGMFMGLVKAHAQGRIELTDTVVDAAETCVWEAIRA